MSNQAAQLATLASVCSRPMVAALNRVLDCHWQLQNFTCDAPAVKYSMDMNLFVLPHARRRGVSGDGSDPAESCPEALTLFKSANFAAFDNPSRGIIR